MVLIVVLLLSLPRVFYTRGQGRKLTEHKRRRFRLDYFTVISTAASGGNLEGESNITLTVQNKQTLSLFLCLSHSLR